MMDEIDVAQVQVDAFLEASLAAAKSIMRAGMPHLYCEGCGEEIPEERRKAMLGCARCAECQAEMEGKR